MAIFMPFFGPCEVFEGLILWPKKCWEVDDLGRLGRELLSSTTTRCSSA